MPRPIKKRVYKRPGSQDEVRNIYSIIMDYYVNNKRFVNLVLGITIAGLIIIFGGGYYLRSKTESALYLRYEGLRAFHDTKNKDATKIAYEKFSRSYEKKKSPYTLLYMAYTASRLGKKDEAVKTLKRLVQEYDSADIQSLGYYKMYEIYLSEKRIDDALKALDSILSLEGEYLKDLAMFEKARLLEGQGKGDEAMKLYERLAKQYPDSPFTKKIKDKIKTNKEKTTGTIGKEEDK